MDCEQIAIFGSQDTAMLGMSESQKSQCFLFAITQAISKHPELHAQPAVRLQVTREASMRDLAASSQSLHDRAHRWRKELKREEHPVMDLLASIQEAWRYQACHSSTAHRSGLHSSVVVMVLKTIADRNHWRMADVAHGMTVNDM